MRHRLTCNYTLKPSIQISIPRTILHESYRRACDAFGLEPLQAASFGKVLRSQFPDVAQRRLGGRGKTRFHYCGFGTSNEREAIKVKSLLEDEKAGKLQLSAGLSAEYASEARAKARSEGQDSETSYRSQRSAEASPGEGHTNAGRALKHEHSPHASLDGSVLGTTGMGTDNRLIASAFATLNSAILTPPGTSSGAGYAGQDALRFSTQAQPLSQGQAEPAASSSTTGFMPRRHTVSHSYSGFSDLGFAPSAHASSEAGDAAGLPSSEVSSFGVGAVSGIAEPAQSGSLLNSPASSLHGYQYIQDPRHMPSSMPFRRSCQDLPDWPTVGGEAGSGSTYGTSTPAAASGGASAGNASLPAESRKAWREYESLCQALLYSIYLGPDPVSFEQRTTLFWTSLSAASREALHADAMLQGMVLRADGIIFRQLLNKLDGMIGDDVADERMPALRSLARMLAERMAELVRDALPEACATTKVQASQRMGESLERVVKIFEAVRTFREESMLDVGGDCDADAAQAWWAANAGAGSAGGPRGLGLAGVVRGSRPRSGTQSSLGSMAGPLRICSCADATRVWVAACRTRSMRGRAASSARRRRRPRARCRRSSRPIWAPCPTASMRRWYANRRPPADCARAWPPTPRRRAARTTPWRWRTRWRRANSRLLCLYPRRNTLPRRAHPIRAPPPPPPPLPRRRSTGATSPCPSLDYNSLFQYPFLSQSPPSLHSSEPRCVAQNRIHDLPLPVCLSPNVFPSLFFSHGQSCFVAGVFTSQWHCFWFTAAEYEWCLQLAQTRSRGWERWPCVCWSSVE